MAPASLPVPAHEIAPAVAGERREVERAIIDWEQERIRLGHALTSMTLNISEMVGKKWSYRFIVSVDRPIDNSAFLFYGSKLVVLMNLPDKPNYSIPMVEQLPARYVPVFTKGCIEATTLGSPVRLSGAVETEQGRQELYRTVFIPFRVKPNPLAFGAFNCRVNDR